MKIFGEFFAKKLETTKQLEPLGVNFFGQFNKITYTDICSTFTDTLHIYTSTSTYIYLLINLQSDMSSTVDVCFSNYRLI